MTCSTNGAAYKAGKSRVWLWPSAMSARLSLTSRVMGIFFTDIYIVLLIRMYVRCTFNYTVYLVCAEFISREYGFGTQ